MQPVPYTPRPLVAPTAKAPSAAPRPAPAPAPRPAPRPQAPRPSPQPVPRPPVPLKIPKTLPAPGRTQGYTATPAPAPSAPNKPMPKLGGQMGRLTPFDWSKPKLKPSDLAAPPKTIARLPPAPPPPPARLAESKKSAPALKKPATFAPITSTPAPSAPSAPSSSSAPAAPAVAVPPAKTVPAPKPKFVLPKTFTITGDAAFTKKVMRDLARISRTKSGQALLESLEKSGKKVEFLLQTVPADGNATGHEPTTAAGDIPGYRKGKKKGIPSNVTIWYDPDSTHVPYDPTDAYAKAKWAKRPAHVGLFHELVHGDDLAHGILDKRKIANIKPKVKGDYGLETFRSELRAVGLIGKSPFSENKYRKELKLPLRDFY
jgi:hypothetical protein